MGQSPSVTAVYETTETSYKLQTMLLRAFVRRSPAVASLSMFPVQHLHDHRETQAPPLPCPPRPSRHKRFALGQWCQSTSVHRERSSLASSKRSAVVLLVAVHSSKFVFPSYNSVMYLNVSHEICGGSAEGSEV